MPKTSAFTPCGLLSLSSLPSLGELMYRAMTAMYGPDAPIQGHLEASIYARAMAIARWRATMQRAINQHYPGKASDLLPVIERDYLVTPAPGDDEPTRRRKLAALYELVFGPRQEYIENALSKLIGDRFLAYRTFKESEYATLIEPTLFPSVADVTTPGNATGGIYGRNDAPLKLARLTQNITLLNVPTSVSIEMLADSDPLQANETVLVQPENDGLVERITVRPGTTETTLVGTFTKVHDSGAFITTGPHPTWSSYQRHVLIIVDDVTQVDKPAIHALMLRAVRGVTTWSIVQPISPGSRSVGPISLTSPPWFGSATFGPITF